MQLINDRTRRVVADLVELAETRKTRRRGLLGRESLQEGAALMIVPCFAIHTAFMRFAIDVVFIDKDGRVVRTVSRMQPWGIATAWRARAVVELPAGRLESLGRRGSKSEGGCAIAIGDRLYLKPVTEHRRAS